MRNPSFTLRQWLVLTAAVFLLNTALSFHNVWPTPAIEVRPELSVEAALVVLLLALLLRFGLLSGRVLWALAGVLLVMTLGRYMEVTAPALYGRAINLYWDARYLPDVAAMFATSFSLPGQIAIVIGLLGLIAGILWVLRATLAVIVDALQSRRPSFVLRSVAGFLFVAWFLGYYTSVPTLGWFAIPVSNTYARQIRTVADAVSGPGALARLPETEPLAVIEPAGLPGGDVLITFVESYGAVAWDAPELAAALREPRAAFEEAVAESGRSVVSAWLEAPTTGGGSWLSHISFMTGFDVDDAALYDALLTQLRPTLPKVFGAAGYRTLALMPGLKNEWPEGTFYGFDEIVGEQTLGYAGPEFGWWRIPDQYALAWLDRNELRTPARQPIFLFFPTISTHAPFRPTPPYQRDWARLLSSEPFDPADLAGIVEPGTSLASLRPAFGDAVAYTYAYWGGFLRETAERDFLLVLVGDHQPPATVAGQGARWDVPVHVITRDAALLARLEARGFAAGIDPGAAPAGGMHELGLMLFD